MIGFDDIPQARWEGYALTSFRQPIDEIAEKSVQWLLSEPAQDSTSELRLDPQLQQRNSLASGFKPKGRAG